MTKMKIIFLIIYSILILDQSTCQYSTSSKVNHTKEISEMSSDNDNNNQTNKNHNDSNIDEVLDSYIHMNSYLLILSMSIAYVFIIVKNIKMIFSKRKEREYFKVSSNEEGIEMAEINDYN